MRQETYTFPGLLKMALKIRQKCKKCEKSTCQEKYTFPDRH